MPNNINRQPRVNRLTQPRSSHISHSSAHARNTLKWVILCFFSAFILIGTLLLIGINLSSNIQLKTHEDILNLFNSRIRQHPTSLKLSQILKDINSFNEKLISTQKEVRMGKTMLNNLLNCI